LQAQLKEERRIREEMQATMQANQQMMEAMVVEREAEHRKMAEIL
jgi:hypothetical protein